jgi:hypothetical protein
MPELGQAMLEHSRTSALGLAETTWLEGREINQKVLTQRRMLEGKRNYILDSLERRIAIWPSESLSYNHSDSAMQVSSFPVSLFQNILVERRETKVVLISVLINIFKACQSTLKRG